MLARGRNQQNHLLRIKGKVSPEDAHVERLMKINQEAARPWPRKDVFSIYPKCMPNLTTVSHLDAFLYVVVPFVLL